MSYTSPRTWSTGELVDQTILNTHIRDNLIALKDPQSAHYEVNEGSDYTTTSGAFTNVDATAGKLSLSITLAVAADVFIFFTGVVTGSVAGAAGAVFFDVTMDGTAIGGDDGLMATSSSDTSGIRRVNTTFMHMKSAVPSGAHTFNLQWKVASGTGTLYAGAGTSNGDVHPQFIVREMS